MSLQVGDPAPAFALPLKPGEAPLQLADYIGEKPVVVLFFPLAFSSVCTQEICEVVNDLPEWRNCGAQVVAVSVDSPFVTQKFAQECGAEFPILSDFNRSVSAAYGVLNENYFGLEGVADRAAFVIGLGGQIIYAWHSPDASELPDFPQIREAIQKSLVDSSAD